MLVGGFPCQAFAIAGKRQGFTDKRGKVFFDIIRIIKHKKPNIYCLKTLKAYSITKKGIPSKLSYMNFLNWGMTYNGKCLTARISDSHSTENVYTLSEILEEYPDQKYFLSKDQVQKISYHKENTTQPKH